MTPETFTSKNRLDLAAVRERVKILLILAMASSIVLGLRLHKIDERLKRLEQTCEARGPRP